MGPTGGALICSLRSTNDGRFHIPSELLRVNSEQFLQWCQLQQSDVTSDVHQPLVMGVLNITPDSFSDGGHFLETSHAYQRAQEMISQGVDLIDIGGESTKPGSDYVSFEAELARVIPVIERIRSTSDICISIDTYKPEVMQAAVRAGASVINDIRALTSEGAITVAAQLNVPICLMHMQGTPKSMQDNPQYKFDVVDEINVFFRQRIDACRQAGIPLKHLILDPGFGYGKLVQHNLCLIKRLNEFKRHHLPLLLGVSRKSTIGVVTQRSVTERQPAGLAVAVFAALQGVSIIRTHDVDETKQALQMIHAIKAC